MRSRWRARTRAASAARRGTRWKGAPEPRRSGVAPTSDERPGGPLPSPAPGRAGCADSWGAGPGDPEPVCDEHYQHDADGNHRPRTCARLRTLEPAAGIPDEMADAG